MTDSYYGVVVWSCVEMDVAVVSACLPTMRPILQAVFPSELATKLYGSGGRSHDQGDSNGTRDGSYYKMSARAKHNEEFQRLPDHGAGTAIVQGAPRREGSQTSDYDSVHGKGTV